MAGKDIGSVYVELGLDPSDYEKGKKVILKGTVSTVKKMEKEWEKHTKSMGGLQSAYVKLAAQVYLLGKAYRVAFRFEEMVAGWAKLSGVQSIAEQQLKQAMISSGRYSDQFYENTLKMAKSMQQLLGIGDEFIIQGQKMLISFARIPEELIPRVTKAMVDLSAFTGRTMEQSARIFGKASLGMTGELRRLAIPIDITTFKMKGFLGVLEQVEHHVQGQVYAIREGYGAWKAYSDQIKEVKERAGDFVNALFIDTGILEDMIDKLQEWNEKLLKFKESGELSDWAAKTASYIIGRIAAITKKFESLYDFIDTKFGTVLDPFVEKIKDILTDLQKMALAVEAASIGGTLGAIIGGPVGAAKGAIAGGLIGYNWNYIEKAYDKVEEFFMGDVPKWFDEQLIQGIDKRIEFYQSRLKYLKGMEKAGLEAYSIGDPDAPNRLRTIQDYVDLIDQLRQHQVGIMRSMAAPQEGFSFIDALASDAPKKAAKNIHELSESMEVYGKTIKNYREQWEIAEGFARMFSGIPYGSYLPGFDQLPKHAMSEEITGLAKDMSTTLQGSIANGIIEGFDKVDYRKLGKSLATNFVKNFVENLSTNTIDPLMGKIFGETGFMSKSAFGGMTYGDIAGAGAMGYGMGGVGGAVGSIGGMWAGSQIGALGSFGGPLGMIAGGLLGGVVDKLFGSSGPNQAQLEELARFNQANADWEQHEKMFGEDFRNTISSAISAGFMAAYASQEYQTFMDAFKMDLGGSIDEAFNSIMMTEMMKPIMGLFQPAFSKINDFTDPDVSKAMAFTKWRTQEMARLQTVIDNAAFYTLVNAERAQLAGLQNPNQTESWGGRTFTNAQWTTLAARGGGTLDQIAALFPDQETFESTMEELQPTFEKVTDYLALVKDALGINTEALGSNTDAILGPVESFLRELTVGQYAPAVNLEGMQAEYAKLYESAYFDPDKFSEYAGFAKSGYLDYMKAYGGYDSAVGGVISNVNDMPWYRDALEKQKEEQQSLSVNNEITLTSNITLNVDGRELGQVLAEQAYNSEDFHTAIETIVQNYVQQG